MQFFLRTLFLFCTTIFFLHGECISPWYARLGTGVNLFHAKVPHMDYQFRPGVVVSGAIGYEWNRYLDGLVFELESAYRWNHISQIKFYGFNTHIHGNLQAVTIMGNVMYKYPWCYPVKPFFGAGGGYGYQRTSLSHFRTNHSRWAVQIFAGLNYLYLDCYEFSLQYQYVDLAKDLKAHSIFLSLLRHF